MRRCAVVGLLGFALWVPACIQANPDYLGQDGSGGPASSGGATTQAATSDTTQGAASSDAMSSSAGITTGTTGPTAEDSSSGGGRTTGTAGEACADGLGGFCYLAPTCVGTQMEPSRTVLGDFDQDGVIDVVAVGRGPDAIEGLSNDGLGGLSSAFFSEEVGARPEDVVLLELDTAPGPEIIVAARDANAVQVFALADGVLGEPTEYDVGNRPAALTIADLTGDGLRDVAVAVRDIDAFVILRSQFDGTLVALDPIMVGGHPEDIEVGDVDGDGFLDVVTADEAGGVSISYGAEGGQLLASIQVLVSDMGRGVALGNLDGTASGLDIATVASSVDGVSLLMTDGTALDAPVTIPAGLQPRDVLARDLNDDGVIDLAVAHSGESSLYVFAGQGDGTFGNPLAIGLSEDGYGVSAADLNGDGIPDLVATAPDAMQICLALSSFER